jgi:hypothetical protein
MFTCTSWSNNSIFPSIILVNPLSTCGRSRFDRLVSYRASSTSFDANIEISGLLVGGASWKHNMVCTCLLMVIYFAWSTVGVITYEKNVLFVEHRYSSKIFESKLKITDKTNRNLFRTMLITVSWFQYVWHVFSVSWRQTIGFLFVWYAAHVVR